MSRQLQNGKNILEKMGRDNRFYSLSEEEKEEDTLACQVRVGLASLVLYFQYGHNIFKIAGGPFSFLRIPGSLLVPLPTCVVEI